MQAWLSQATQQSGRQPHLDKTILLHNPALIKKACPYMTKDAKWRLLPPPPPCNLPP